MEKKARGSVGCQWRRQGEGQISRQLEKWVGDGVSGRHLAAKDSIFFFNSWRRGHNRYVVADFFCFLF